MITKEVNDWFKKVEKGNYSSWDIMEEFVRISKHLSKEDIKQVEKKLHSCVKN
jgi:hypothetical protein